MHGCRYICMGAYIYAWVQITVHCYIHPGFLLQGTRGTEGKSGGKGEKGEQVSNTFDFNKLNQALTLMNKRLIGFDMRYLYG